MIEVGERLRIQELLTAGVSVREVAQRTGRSLATIYNYRHRIIRQDNCVDMDTTSARNKITYKPAIRVETEPGEQAQVDWGSFGSVWIGDRKEKLYAFFYILSYSRMMYVEFVVRQNLHTLQNCHMNAFDKLGVPQEIRYDNMKTVVLSHRRIKGARPIIRYNPAFIDFSRYYGFKPFACPPYWPRAKGKVERAIKFLRHSFVVKEEARLGRKFLSLQDLNDQVDSWLSKQSTRIHGTTLQRPIDRYKQERGKLVHTNRLPRYIPAAVQYRLSTKDGLVAFNGSLYSVPQQFARRKVYIRESSNRGIPKLEIYYDNKLIASHHIPQNKGSWVIEEEHIRPADSSRLASKRSNTTVPGSFCRDSHDITVASRPLSYYERG